MHLHPRSITDKIFEIWRSPGRFTKNPDIIALPAGRLMLIYADTDAHWSQENQILTLLASDDGGQTWFKHREIDRADLRQGDERLVTPRLSRLNDDRLVVIIDHDDHGHFHEDQPPGNWLYWSEDDGDTWHGPDKPDIMGFEPDRILNLPDGRLGVGTHVMRGETQEFAEILSCSDDGGQNWYEAATIAYDGYHRFCEGAIIILDEGKELACVMRENHHAGIPSFVSFSQDSGRTWSSPQMCPFALDRPYGKQLPDGRVLVTGRHMNGPLGTYGWCGDLKAEAGSYQIGGPRRKFAAHLSAAHLSSEALTIDNLPGHEGRYCLLPPESARSEVVMEATLKVEGRPGQAAAFMAISQIGVVLQIAVDGLWTRRGAEFRYPVDMSGYHTVRLHHRRGLLQVQVDGETVINQCVFRENQRLGTPQRSGELSWYTHFGQPAESGGRSHWQQVSYSAKNATLDDFAWSWQAAGGEYPDSYQRQRMIQIHSNHPDQPPNPDHGYSSWVILADGRIMFVDYTNYGDPAGSSHLVGAFIDMEDLRYMVQVRLTLYREKARQSYFVKRKTYGVMNDSPKILRFTAYVLRGLFAMCQSNFPDF